MGLFDKLREPVVLKENSDAKVALEQLDSLLKTAPENLREQIEHDKRLVYYGIKGEESLLFELKNSHIPMYILHDVFFEENGLKTQIDYIVITRKLVLIIECKNLYGNISIDSQGNFTRTIQYGKHYRKEGIYSPITQNQRHLDMIREKRRSSKGTLGKILFDKFFDSNYKSVVVLANPRSVLDMKYAPKEIKSQIVKVDGLNNYIKKLNNESSNESMSDKQMKEMADFFISNSVPNTVDFLSKYQSEIKTFEIEENIISDVNLVVDNKNVEITKYDDKEADSENIDDKLTTDIDEDTIEDKIRLNNDSVSINSTSDEAMLNLDIEKLPVYKALREYRYNKSKIEKVKPYFIFNNSQMECIIKANPKTIDELKRIKGFADIKCSKYGDDILRILREYL